MNRQLKNESGMTLIELTIALAILSIGILSVGSMQMASTKGNASAKHLTDLSYIAARTSEQLYDFHYDDERLSGDPKKNPHIPDPASDGIDNDWDGIVDPDASKIKENADLIGIKWIVEDDIPVKNMKTITVTVNGKPVSGPKEVSIKFYKRERY